MDFQLPNPSDIQTCECQILPNWHLTQKSEAGGHASWQTYCPVCPAQLCDNAVRILRPSVFQSIICRDFSVLPALKDICKHLAIPFKKVTCIFFFKTHKAISQPLFSTSAVLTLAQHVFFVFYFSF